MNTRYKLLPSRVHEHIINEIVVYDNRARRILRSILVVVVCVGRMELIDYCLELV